MIANREIITRLDAEEITMTTELLVSIQEILISDRIDTMIEITIVEMIEVNLINQDTIAPSTINVLLNPDQAETTAMILADEMNIINEMIATDLLTMRGRTRGSQVEPTTVHEKGLLLPCLKIRPKSPGITEENFYENMNGQCCWQEKKVVSMYS